MKALAVFHGHSDHILAPFLKRGFRHCFAAVVSGPYWIRIDAQAGYPDLEAVALADYDLATFYRAEGYAVIETQQRSDGNRGIVTLSNCVGMVKTVLAVNAPLVMTPWQLYRRLTRAAFLPGSSGIKVPKPFSLETNLTKTLLGLDNDKPKVPDIPPPPPPPPDRKDLDGAGRRARLDELKRRGRRATITTSTQGDTSTAPLGRPAAKLGA